MADTAVTVSLKGGEARWRGLGDESTMLPSSATFSTLSGCYISKDGTEIRRVPGQQLGGRPFFGQEFDIATITSGADPTITLTSGLAEISSKDSCYLNASAFDVYITGSSDITTGAYTATRTDVNAFQLVGQTSSGTTADGKVLVRRIAKTHALTHVADRVVAVGETVVYKASGATPVYNVGAAVSSRPLAFVDTDPDDKEKGPPGPAIQAAYGSEHGFVLWQSPTMTGIEDGVGPENSANNLLIGAQDINMLRRLSVTVLNRKVVAAVPGSGCLWQVDIGAGPPWNTVRPPDVANVPNHRFTKALGIPKGSLGLVTATTGSGGVWNTAAADIWIAFAAAYWDPSTGEIGLISERRLLRLQVSVETINIQIVYPRGMLYETVGLGVILFMSRNNSGEEQAADDVLYPVEYLGPYAQALDRGQTTFTPPSTYTAVRLSHTLDITFKTQVFSGQEQPPKTLRLLPNRTPFLEFMAPGATCVQAVKGRVLSGGAVPDKWQAPAWPKIALDQSQDPDSPHVHLPFQCPMYQVGEAVTAPCAHGMFPASYGGALTQVATDTAGTGRGRIVKQVNELGYNKDIVLASNAAVTFVDAGASGDYMQLDAGSWGVPVAGTGITVSGTSSNNGSYTVVSATSSLIFAEGLTNESAASATITWNSASLLWGFGPNTFETDFTYGDTASPFTSSNNEEFIVENQGLRGRFSEEGVHGVVPAINNLDMDSAHGANIRGIGKVGDAALYMTETETFLFSWNTAPRQSSQVTVSTRFGCASPPSVVNGPFGCAWLSREGPVVFAGQGVQWIGRTISEFWKTVQKDQNGDVWYSTAAVDIERSLVIWSVSVGDGSWDGTDENASSKWSSNRLLIWNYSSGVFSTVTLGGARTTDAIGTLPYREDDGTYTMRPSFTCQYVSTDNVVYHPIYGWDEDSEDRRASAVALAVDAARTAGTATVSVTSGASAFATGDNAFIRNSAGTEIKWFGTITVDSDVQVTVADDDGADWKSGDKLVCGVLPMQLTTHRVRFGDDAFDNRVSGIVIRANKSATYAYARVTATDQDGNVSYFTSRWGDALKDGTTRFRQGHFVGTEIILDIRVWADGRVNIKDISLEVEGGER